MTRIILRATIILAAMAMGWVAAKAQTAGPAFELVVDAPVGPTTITCVKGCTLAWVERGVNPNDTPTSTFSFKCGGPNVERCSSRKVGGWIAP